MKTDRDVKWTNTKDLDMHIEKIAKNLMHDPSNKLDPKLAHQEFYLSSEGVALLAASRLLPDFLNFQIYCPRNLVDFALMISLLKKQSETEQKVMSACFLVKDSAHYECAYIYYDYKNEKDSFAVVLDSAQNEFNEFQTHTMNYIAKCFPHATVFYNFTIKGDSIQKDDYSCSIFALNWAFQFGKIGTQQILDYFQKNEKYASNQPSDIKLKTQNLPFELIKLRQLKKEKYFKFVDPLLKEGQAITSKHKKYQKIDLFQDNFLIEENLFSKDFNDKNLNIRALNKEKKWQDKFLIPMLRTLDDAQVSERLNYMYGVHLYQYPFLSRDIVKSALTAVALPVTYALSNETSENDMEQDECNHQKVFMITIPHFKTSSTAHIFLTEKNIYAFKKPPTDYNLEYTTDNEKVTLRGNPDNIAKFIVAIKQELHPLSLKNPSSSIIALDLVLNDMLMLMAPYISSQIKNQIFDDLGLMISENTLMSIKALAPLSHHEIFAFISSNQDTDDEDEQKFLENALQIAIKKYTEATQDDSNVSSVNILDQYNISLRVRQSIKPIENVAQDHSSSETKDENQQPRFRSFMFEETVEGSDNTKREKNCIERKRKREEEDAFKREVFPRT